MPQQKLWRVLLILGVTILVATTGFFVILVQSHRSTSDTSANGGPSPDGTDGSSPDGAQSADPSGSASPSPGASPSAGPTSTGGGAGGGGAGGASGGGGSTGGNARTGCLAAADRCGYPTAANTGVPAGVALTVVNGDLHMNTPGKVYDALDVRGCVQVEADNVTLRRSKVNGRSCNYFVVNNEVGSTPRTGLLVEDVEIDITGQFNTKAIIGGTMTVRRVHIFGGADCVHYSSNVVIEDTLCEVAKIPANSDAHADGFQSSGGSGVVIRHNTILNANSQTSAIINGTDTTVLSPQYNVRILNNLMAGGGWTVYCNAHYASTVPTIEFRDNRISKTYFSFPGVPARGGYYGPLTDCDGVPGVNTTIWDEDGKPIPPA